MMTKLERRWLVALMTFPVLALLPLALALGAASCGDLNQASSIAVAEAPEMACPPTVPDPSLTPPAGNRAAFSLDATGVQVYTCKPGQGWVFAFPEAILVKASDGGDKIQVFHTAGPTWQALDLSSVVGAKVAGVTVDATAIPWLLLSASSHTGDGKMSEVTFIQRLSTTGGIAPATTCDATTAGNVARVPYAATYVFWRAGRTQVCN